MHCGQKNKHRYSKNKGLKQASISENGVIVQEGPVDKRLMNNIFGEKTEGCETIGDKQNCWRTRMAHELYLM